MTITGNSMAAERMHAWPVRLFIHRPVQILIAYFLIHAVIRWSLGAPANLDEAEQFALADHFAFGYGSHPPLYQWLQTAAFGVFGVNYLAIAVLKNALLAGAWLCVWRIGIEVTGNRVLAAVGAFGLLFSPNLSWESQIDHTHTVSNTFLVALTTLLLFRLLRTPRLGTFLGLGMAIGLGLVAKYNFILFLLAALLAFATHPGGRRVITDRRFLLALAIGVAVALPHYLYIAFNPVEGTAKLGNLGINRYGFVEARLQGMVSLLTAAGGVHGIWLALILLGWIDRKRDPRPVADSWTADHGAASALFLRLWLFVSATFLLLVLGGTTTFRDHWLQPESIMFPLAVAVFFSRYIDRTAFSRLAGAAIVLLILIPVAVVANKRLHPGAQRDAGMPDPAAIAAAFPEAAAGRMPIVLASGEYRNRWYGAGHLRYWLQIPTPIFKPDEVTRMAVPQIRLIPHGETDPAAGDRVPVKIPYFRTGIARPAGDDGWRAVLVDPSDR